MAPNPKRNQTSKNLKRWRLCPPSAHGSRSTLIAPVSVFYVRPSRVPTSRPLEIAKDPVIGMRSAFVAAEPRAGRLRAVLRPAFRRNCPTSPSRTISMPAAMIWFAKLRRTGLVTKREVNVCAGAAEDKRTSRFVDAGFRTAHLSESFYFRSSSSTSSLSRRRPPR
jgi:hypothetical protein